jgi:hypothetical protein
MRKAPILAICAALLLVVAGVVVYFRTRPIGVQAARIFEVRIDPQPEGPPGPRFQRSLSDRWSLPLSYVVRDIPTPLPHPDVQLGCSSGSDVVIKLDDGSEIRYGPCRRPGSINQLRTFMVSIWEQHCPPCVP